jgi:pimeloyl-ACP methyl ester carboxylesterase
MSDRLRAETDRRCADLAGMRRNLSDAGIEIAQCDWRDTRLALLRSANPGKPPVLLLHGVTYSSASVFDLKVPGHARDSFSTMLQLSKRELDCWALDFAGYGFSDTHDDAGIETPDDYVSQVIAALDHIHLETNRRPVLIGWSWGAQVASRAAAQAPDRLDRLVFWGGFWGGSGRLRDIAKRKVPPGPRRSNTQAHAKADFLTVGTYLPEVETAFVDHALRLDPSSPMAGIYHSTLNLPLHDPQRIQCPTLVIHGANDPVVNALDIQDFTKGIGRNLVAHHVIPDADHNAQFSENRNLLFDLLADFATGMETPSQKELAL